jgi:hypothetical protein
MPISDAEARSIIHENRSAEGKLERIKAESKAVAAKAVVGAAAFGTGFAIGLFNTQQGGTSTTPANIGGTSGIPIDTAAAGVGLVALILARKSTLLPLAAGVAGGALGVLGARYGAQYEPNLLGASSSTSSTATTPASSTSPAGSTTSGMVGFSPMVPRMGRPHGSYGVRPNPYARTYAR